MEKSDLVDSETQSSAERIMNTAADLIAQKGLGDVGIKEMASGAAVSPAHIHSLFGGEEKSSTKAGVFRRIFNSFFKHTNQIIFTGLRYQQPSATAVEQLVVILRATLDALRFSPVFGKAVLRELNIQERRDDNAAVFEVFERVEKLIEEAREKDQISETAKVFKNWEVRQALFVLMHGLLRCKYLKEGMPEGSSELTNDKIEILVLSFLQVFCSDAESKRINQIIESRKKVLTDGTAT